MLTIFFMGLFLFFTSIMLFKFFFFLISVLMAGAGFIIKSLVILVLGLPLIPLMLVIGGSILSFSSIVLIAICGSMISYLTVGGRKYS